MLIQDEADGHVTHYCVNPVIASLRRQKTVLTVQKFLSFFYHMLKFIATAQCNIIEDLAGKNRALLRENKRRRLYQLMQSASDRLIGEGKELSES